MNDHNPQNIPDAARLIKANDPRQKPVLTSKQAFLIGALGGIAPMLVRGAVSVSSSGGRLPAIEMSQIIGYSFAVLVFAGIGGAVAIWLDDARTRRSAFLIGASLPSLFHVGGLQSDAPVKSTADISRPFHIAFVSSAFAQEPTGNQEKAPVVPTLPDDVVGTQRKLEVSTPRSPISNDVSATFLDKSGNVIASKTIQPGFAAVSVPADAAAVRFQKDGAASESHPLSDHPVQSANVEIEQKALSAFAQAVGLSREAKPSIDAKMLVDAKKLPERTYGWCYLGDRGADGWRIRAVDFQGEGMPEKGTIVKANVPLVIRKTFEGTDVVGVALTGQSLRVEEIKNRGTDYWAAVTVVE